MSYNNELDEARKIITLNEQNLVCPVLDRAAKYLEQNINNEGSWGPFKGLPLDLHVSSLSIEALRVCNCARSESLVLDAASFIKSIIVKEIESYDALKLVDSLNIISGSKPRDKELEHKISERLKGLRRNEGWGETEPSMNLSCNAILALMRLEDPPMEIIRQWNEYLKRNQCQEDGGWGATPDSNSDIISTCHAMHVLSWSYDKLSSDIIDKAINYFKKFVDKKSWESLDTFETAHLLHALAGIKKAPLGCVQIGIESLHKRANSDGGWGAADGEPSNIEITALCMIALQSAGGNKFVPAWIVNTIFEMAEKKLTKLQRKVNEFENDMQQQVEDKVKHIIIENENIKHELNAIKEEREALRKDKEELSIGIKDCGKQINEMRKFEKNLRNSLEVLEQKIKIERLWYMRADSFAIMAAIITISITIYLLYLIYPESSVSINLDVNSVYYGLVISIILVIIGIALASYQKKYCISQDQSQWEYRTQKNQLVHRFMEIMDDWPQSDREEFLFQLSRMMNIPLDIDDSSKSLIEKYGEMDERLHELISQFIILPPSVRTSIVDDIRNSGSSYAKK
jgi:hypothetical protein